MKRKSPILHYINTGILFVVIGFIIAFRFLNQAPSLRVPFVPNRYSPIPGLWVHQGLYIEPDENRMLVVAGNKLIFNGSFKPDDEPFHVFAIDKFSGRSAWQYAGNADALAVSDSLVFVGGGEKVTALNLDGGRIVWSTNLPLIRGVTRLYVKDDVLYVGTFSKSHFILEIETGNIIKTISYILDKTCY